MMILERIRRCVGRGCYDPVEIAKELGDVSPVEVAYYIDMEGLLPATVDLAETYEAETFPKLVACVPGILQKTRQTLEVQYHQVMGAKLLADLLGEYLQDKNGVIFRSRPRSDFASAGDVYYVRFLYDRNTVRVVYSATQPLVGRDMTLVYLGQNYEGVLHKEILSHRPEVVKKLRAMIVSRVSSFVECSQEELPVVHQLESAFWLAVSGKSPVTCRFYEPFFVKWLTEHGPEVLGREEVKFLVHLLRAKELSKMTPLRANLYTRAKAYNRTPLTKVFFQKDKPEEWVSNANTLIDYVSAQHPTKLVEQIPVCEIREYLPKLLDPQKGLWSVTVYLVKYYPGFGVLTPSKTRHVLQELVAGKRSELYKSFFYDPASPVYGKGQRYSDEEIQVLRSRGLENARMLVREYVHFKGIRLEDLRRRNLSLLFSAARLLPLRGLNKLFHRVRVIMNKLFPDEYAELILEDAIILLLHTDSSKQRQRKRVYFDDGQEDKDVYTSEEITRIQERCRRNARVVVQAYLLLHPEKELDLLDKYDIASISERLFRTFGGRSARVFLNRLFPDEFLVLDEEEKAVALMDAQDREKFALTMRYIPPYGHLEEEPGGSQRLYTEEDLERIRARTKRNVQFLFKTSMKRAGIRFLEELDYTTANGFIEWDALHNAIAPRSDGARNTVRLLKKLFFNEYAVLTPEKYRYWKYETNQGKRKILSNVFFMLPEPQDEWTEEESEKIREQSKQNAYLALELYMKERDIQNVNGLTKYMIEKGLSRMICQVFELPNVQALLHEMFPDDFAVLTTNHLKEYFSASVSQKQLLSVAYFGKVQSREYEGYANRSRLSQKWFSNALIALLWAFKVHNLSWGRLEQVREGRPGTGVDIFAVIPYGTLRLLGAAKNNLTQLADGASPYLYHVNDPERFFWLNIGEITNLVQFFELDNPDNVAEVVAVPDELLGIVCDRIFSHGYPFASHERNEGVIESKVRLLLYLQDKVLQQIIPEKVEQVFARACSDHYQKVRQAGWDALGRVWQVQSTLIAGAFRFVLQWGKFSKGDWRVVPKAAQPALRNVAEEVNTDILRVLDLLGDKEDYHQALWYDEYHSLVQVLKGRFNAFRKRRGLTAEDAVKVASEVLSHNLLFLKAEACHLLAEQVGLTGISARAQLIPLLPALLLDRDERLQKDGVAVLRAVRIASPGFSDDERALLVDTVQSVKEKLISGRF